MSDLYEYSAFSQQYDTKQLFSGGKNSEYVIESEIYNLIVPEGLRGWLFSETG